MKVSASFKFLKADLRSIKLNKCLMQKQKISTTDSWESLISWIKERLSVSHFSYTYFLVNNTEWYEIFC